MEDKHPRCLNGWLSFFESGNSDAPQMVEAARQHRRKLASERVMSREVGQGYTARHDNPEPRIGQQVVAPEHPEALPAGSRC